MNRNLSDRQFDWDHVKKSIDPRDMDMVEDYTRDLTGKHPSEMSWRYGQHPVPAGLNADDDRRDPGYTESLRQHVAVGRTPPITVVHTPRGIPGHDMGLTDKTVVDGWHRIRAASLNGQKTVEAWHGQ